MKNPPRGSEKEGVRRQIQHEKDAEGEVMHGHGGLI